MEKYEELGLKTSFESTVGSRVVSFRKDRSPWANVDTIEIRQDGDPLRAIQTDPKDNIEMAIAVLGVGRVTDAVEDKAQGLATKSGYTEEQMLEYAVTNLRAAMIIRERDSAEAKKDLEDAYALYKLAYPDSQVKDYEFPNHTARKFWIANLRKIRQDPTALGAL